MPITKTVKVPPSSTEQTVEITIPDDALQIKITGGTPIPIPEPPKPDPVPEVPGYEQTYFNDFDQASDLVSNQLGRGKQVTFDGRGVFMSEVRSGDAAISNGFRSEQQYDNPQGTPQEGKWEWEAYYQDWNSVKGNGHSFQFHPKSSSGSAVWSLQNYNGKFDVVRSLNGNNFHQEGSLKAVEQNRWYKFRLEAKWSAGNDGYLRFYIDDKLYHEYKGQTCTSIGVYVKIGQNCWSPVPTRAVVYYDDFRVSKKIA